LAGFALANQNVSVKNNTGFLNVFPIALICPISEKIYAI
jgi:hypothetical protein